MQHQFTNALVNESSPYLLQHAHNPVNWMPWRGDVLATALAQQKLIVVSIGYSACHWCHVMEHESFEDESVAQIMNEHFISIKVDREERPDVDQVYMDAAQLVSGRGGWPLNAICLPDGKPVFAGTYFPPDRWKQVLRFFVNEMKNNREAMLEQAESLTRGIRQMDVLKPTKENSELSEVEQAEVFEKLAASWDFENGGRAGAPKFPMPVNLRFLLQHYQRTGNEKALRAAQSSLDGMMNGGIYDQVGGGFARYSVDEYWMIPHFEKMLYDNAQLIAVFAEAFALTRNERYKEVVMETIAFMQREWRNDAAGYFGALDADSEGEEGKFYVWTADELKTLLGEEFENFSEVFATEVNFEGHIHLQRKSLANPSIEKLQTWKSKLLAARQQRVQPGLDDKTLCSWNALLCSGYVAAYKAIGMPEYLAEAESIANFLLSKMRNAEGGLLRSYKLESSSIPAFLEDYAFTIAALTDLFQCSVQQRWLDEAVALLNRVKQQFSNPQSPLFYFTAENDSSLIARKTDSSDNVIPAANSVLAKSLFTLGTLLDKEDWRNHSTKMLTAMRDLYRQHPAFYAKWTSLAEWHLAEPHVVAIVGPQSVTKFREMSAEFLPNTFYLLSEVASDLPLLSGKYVEGQTLIYVCQGKSCRLPVTETATALTYLKQ